MVRSRQRELRKWPLGCELGMATQPTPSAKPRSRCDPKTRRLVLVPLQENLMTQTPPENQPPQGDPNAPPGEPDQAELSRRERARLEDENRTLRLDNVATRLGLDTSKGLGKLFADSYKGEVTEDAVKAAATEYELLKPPETPPPPTGDVTDPEQRRQTAEREAAAAGTTPDGQGPTEDPRITAVKVGDQVMADGGTMETAMGSAFDTIAAAGYGGRNEDGTIRKPDPRAQFNPGAYDPRRPDQGW